MSRLLKEPGHVDAKEEAIPNSIQACVEKRRWLSNSTLFKTNNQVDGTRKIVIIDDDPFICELCEIILKKHQIDAVSYRSGEEFFSDDRKPKEQNFIFLIDMRLPGMSGKLLLKKLREKFDKDNAIIAMTAQLLDEEEGDLYVDGFDEVLMKPFTEDQLIALLNKTFRSFSQNDNAHPENNDIPDLNNLYKMAGQDEELVSLFVKQFVSDSKSDMEMLTKAAAEKDILRLLELAHRIAGRCGQMGAYSVASAFRKLEVTCRGDQTAVESQMLSVQNASDQLNKLLHYFTERNWQ